jgi:hypothetical protein
MTFWKASRPTEIGGLGVSFGGRLGEFGSFPFAIFCRLHAIAAFPHVPEESLLFKKKKKKKN